MPRVRAEIDPDVMRMVEEALAADPDTPVAELHERASALSPDMAGLSTRQFHARYPLQVKRRWKRERSTPSRPEAPAARPRRATSSAAPDRDAVRRLLMEFASDLEGAEQRKELVRLLANIDDYVDRVIAAARPTAR